jgi:uracil-DNA glycosylase
MPKPYFQPFRGDRYQKTRLLVLGQSAYSWPDDEGKIEVPKRSHPTTSVRYSIENFEDTAAYFRHMARAPCGSETPTREQRKQAWHDYAYAIFIQGTVGKGAVGKHTARQLDEAGPIFLALIEDIRPAKVIVTGKDLWKNMMPKTSVSRGADLQAYELNDGSLVWCFAIPHPANRTQGFSWRKVNKSIQRFRSAKLPVRT